MVILLEVSQEVNVQYINAVHPLADYTGDQMWYPTLMKYRDARIGWKID